MASLKFCSQSLARLHANKEDKEKRQEVQLLKEMLKGGNRKQVNNNTVNKKGKVVEAPSKDNKKENIKRNSEVSSYLSLSENAVDKGKDSDTSRSL